MGKDCGREDQEIAINMKDLIKVIRNGDMEYLIGRVETCTKEIIKETYETVMDRCIGIMVVIIKANG
jgi:hypothetical protein